MTTDRTTERDTRSVVFVGLLQSRRRSALLRAVALAATQGAPLHVVLSIGVHATSSRLLFSDRGIDSTRPGWGEGQRVALARAWVERWAPSASIEVDLGDPCTVAIGSARRLDAGLVVLAADDLASRRDAVWLATEASVPVLVVRTTLGRTAVLAATDLSDPRMPVIAHASMVADKIRAPVVAIHNMPRAVVLPMTPYGAARVMGPTLNEVRATADRLKRYAWDRCAVSDTLVASEPNAAMAVLHAATELGADIVAVGARRRNWLDRMLFGGVAETVVERSESSVLVTPLAARR